FRRAFSDLARPAAAEHLARRILPVSGSYRRDGLLESTETGQPQVEHHIQDDILAHRVEARKPRERARHVTSHRGDVVVEKHQCLGARDPRVMQIPANSYRELALGVAVALPPQSFMSNQHPSDAAAVP